MPSLAGVVILGWRFGERKNRILKEMFERIYSELIIYQRQYKFFPQCISSVSLLCLLAIIVQHNKSLLKNKTLICTAQL